MVLPFKDGREYSIVISVVPAICVTFDIGEGDGLSWAWADINIKANAGMRLSTHEPARIVDYLNAKGRLTNLPEWWLRQMADALSITIL